MSSSIFLYVCGFMHIDSEILRISPPWGGPGNRISQSFASSETLANKAKRNLNKGNLNKNRRGVAARVLVGLDFIEKGL